MSQKITDFKNVVIIDASTRKVMTARMENGKAAAEFASEDPALETTHQALAKVCDDFGKIDAFAVCTGPGSVLGIRVAAAAVSSIAAIRGIEVFEYDAMETAAYAAAEDLGKDKFSLIAPSRKGFTNVLNFENGKILSKNEIEIERLEEDTFEIKYLLDQRAESHPKIDAHTRVSAPPARVFEIFKLRPELAKKCPIPPDAKSPGKREYVKWKAPARI